MKLGFHLPASNETAKYYKVPTLSIMSVSCARLASTWAGAGMWGASIIGSAASAANAIVVLPPLFGAGTNNSGVTTSPQGPTDSTNGNGTAATLAITSISGSSFSLSYNGGTASTTKFAYNSTAAQIQTALNSTAGVSGASVTASQTAGTFLLTFPTSMNITPSLLTTNVSGSLTTGATMTLTDVAAGVWDAMFGPALAEIASAKPSAIIKIGDEMSGDWFPWCGSTVAIELAAAHQHLVTLARTYSVTFQFDWNGAINFLGYDPMTTSGAYPGDSYVDYISCDYYDGLGWDAVPSSGRLYGAADWNYFAANFAPEGMAFAALHGKPYCLTEWGLGQATYSNGVEDDPAWIEAAYYWMRAHAASLGYLVYFQDDESSWPGGLQLNPQSAAVFTNLFGAWAQELAGNTTHRFLTTGINRYRIK
jgi:hypothetical protein